MQHLIFPINLLVLGVSFYLFKKFMIRIPKGDKLGYCGT